MSCILHNPRSRSLWVPLSRYYSAAPVQQSLAPRRPVWNDVAVEAYYNLRVQLEVALAWSSRKATSFSAVLSVTCRVMGLVRRSWLTALLRNPT